MKIRIDRQDRISGRCSFVHVRFTGPMQVSYYRAISVDDAIGAKRRAGPAGLFVGGGTALQLGWHEDAVPPPIVDVAGLRRDAPCRLADGALEICAFTPLEELRCDPIVRRHFGLLADATGAIAAFGVRTLGTLGGNLLWPKGDLRPLALAADAILVFAQATISFADWLDCLLPDDLLIAVRIPLPVAALTFEKVGYRAAFSPSNVTMAFSLDREEPRIAIGGGDNLTGRLRAAERAYSRTAIPAGLAHVVLEEGLLTSNGDMSAAVRAEVVARVLAGFARKVT